MSRELELRAKLDALTCEGCRQGIRKYVDQFFVSWHGPRRCTAKGAEILALLAENGHESVASPQQDSQDELRAWIRIARKAVCPRCSGDVENDGMPTLRGISFGVGPRKKLWWHGDPHTGMQCRAHGLLILPLTEFAVDAVLATPQMGTGDYSCVACGMGMIEPCEHWKKMLSQPLTPDDWPPQTGHGEERK